MEHAPGISEFVRLNRNLIGERSGIAHVTAGFGYSHDHPAIRRWGQHIPGSPIRKCGAVHSFGRRQFAVELPRFYPDRSCCSGSDVEDALYVVVSRGIWVKYTGVQLV